MKTHSKAEDIDPALLRGIFDLLPEAIVIQDLKGNILNANGAACRLFNITPDKLIGTTIADLFTPESREKWLRSLKKLLNQEWTFIESTDHRLLHGRTASFSTRIISRTNYGGQQSVVLYLQNILIYQTTEKALVASLEQWQLSFDAITDCICVLDQAGKIVRANQSMLKRFTPANEKLIGMDYHTVLAFADAGGTEIPDAMTESPYVLDDITLKNTRGRYSISAFPLKNKDGRLLGAEIILRDMPGQNHGKDILPETDVTHQHAATMNVIGGIAHDFNNLLTAILGYGILLLREMKKDHSGRAKILEIVHAAERASALSQQLMDMHSRQVVKTQAININLIITEMLPLLHTVLGDQVQLVTQLDPSLWNVKAIKSSIERIIVNLAFNAHDAMPQGGRLKIKTSNATPGKSPANNHPELGSGNYVVIEVTDTGMGISTDNMQQLFKPFFTTKEKGKGTGLGLSTSQTIIKQFDGQIFCKSEVNRGTTFTIYLPQALEPASPDPEPEIKTNTLYGNETILVVDDEQSIVGLIEQTLTKLGYHVLPATNAEEALAISATYSGTIHLVLADIVMPGISGTELVNQLLEKRPDIRMLFISGYARPADMPEKDIIFLPKPFTFNSLSDFVRNVLDKKPGQKVRPVKKST